MDYLILATFIAWCLWGLIWTLRLNAKMFKQVTVVDVISSLLASPLGIITPLTMIGIKNLIESGREFSSPVVWRAKK